MRFSTAASFTTLALLVLPACGGQTANGSGTPDADKHDVSTVNPGHDASSPNDATPGTDTGTPVLPPPNDGGPTNDSGAGVCPASYSIATKGGPCTDPSARCDYDMGTCFCTTSPGGLPMGHPIGSDAAITAVWSCSELEQGCPPNPPAIGSACASSVTCDYGQCMGGSSLQCMSGTWEMAFGACPG
jgi:hypothetical protein